jgi:coenzyme F420 biosynthesis associated uncharacterized protein
MVDWSLSRRLAVTLAGEGPATARRPAELADAAAEAERLVAAYSGLRAGGPLPSPELVDRNAWIDANLRSLPAVLEPAFEHLGEGTGPLAPALRGAAGVLVAAEVGVLLGYAGRRVLGQYEVVILDPDATPRLLFVAPNLDDAARELGADGGELLRWVALHEVTHALQFGAVPWLRAHMAALVRELLESLRVSLEPRRLLRLPSPDDLRALIDAVAGDGDLLALVTSPRQRAALDRLQAVMAVIEGHAEHVMDAAGAEILPSVPALRVALERRRAARSGPARLLARLLGFETKLRQYRVGKRFCDEVVAAAGIAALNRVWSAPEALPTLSELEDPARWVERTHPGAATRAST